MQKTGITARYRNATGNEARRRQDGAGRLRAGLLAGGLALQLLALPALAQGDAPQLDQARKLLAAGHPGEAADLLNQDLLQMAGNPDYDYLLGQALYQSGHADQALFAYERVAMAEPGNVDVRLKMAQINAERGNAALGREILAPLAGQSLSPPQQQALDQVKNTLAALGSGGRTSVQGYVLAGFGWDSNVTSGPDQRSLVIPALGTAPTDLGGASQAHDLVGLAEAGLSLNKPVGENTWLIGNGSARQNV